MATIEGMHCEGCEQRVEKRLSTLDGVRSVDADHEAGTAKVRFVTGQEDIEAIQQAIEDLGFAFEGIEDS